jgi:mRNA interferase MazF
MTRGDIWWADFGIPFRSEPGFRRPVLILQNDAFTKSKLNTIIVIPFTTNLLLENAPGNILVDKEETKLSKDSVIVVSQIYAIDKRRLVERISTINRSILLEVEYGIELVLGIDQ